MITGKRGKNMEKNYNFLIYYNQLEYYEKMFFERITEVMIHFPSLWYNFVENVLKNRIVFLCEDHILIFSLGLLDSNTKGAFDMVYQILLESGVVDHINCNQEFLILYLNSKHVSAFFHNTGFWLEYLTAYACHEIGLSANRGVVIKTSDNHIQEVDVMVDVDGILFFIECKDTVIYDEKDYHKLQNLLKKIDHSAFGLFVVTKNANKEHTIMHQIDCIKYNYNYYDFVESLKDTIIQRLISISF